MKKALLVLVVVTTIFTSVQVKASHKPVYNSKGVYNKIAIWENGKMIDEDGTLWAFKFPNRKPCVVMLTIDGKGTMVNTDDEITRVQLLEKL